MELALIVCKATHPLSLGFIVLNPTMIVGVPNRDLCSIECLIILSWSFEKILAYSFTLKSHPHLSNEPLAYTDKMPTIQNCPQGIIHFLES